MTNDERKKLYQALSAPFTEDAIERTEGRITGRGYDTSGIKYQYVVNRLNEVLGIGGWRTQQNIALREITTSKGRAAIDATHQFDALRPDLAQPDRLAAALQDARHVGEFDGLVDHAHLALLRQLLDQSPQPEPIHRRIRKLFNRLFLDGIHP